MKTNPTIKFLLTIVALTSCVASARAGEAAWNISTMTHEPTPATSDKGWTGNGLTIEEKDGKLVIQPAANEADRAKGQSSQRYVPLAPGFDWLVMKVDRITQPDSGYRCVNIMVNGGNTVRFSTAGNVPDELFITLKRIETSTTTGILRLDSTMNELVISDLGLYDAPLPRLEFAMPDTSEEMVPASSEFTVELRLDAPAQGVSISLFDGSATIPIQISQGQSALDLEHADVEKKIWRGKLPLAGAVFRGQSAAEKGSLGAGMLLIKATVEGNAKVQEIWTANSRGIDLTK